MEISRTSSFVTVARLAVAAVWFYEGLWCKVLGQSAQQRSIVAQVPGVRPHVITAIVVAVGLVETAIGVWALSGRWARPVAIVQTTLVVVFNAGGLFFAGGQIADPVRMLTDNAVLLALVWLLARPELLMRPQLTRPQWRVRD